MKTQGGKRTCKYYESCGNTENCLRCDAYQKKDKNDKKKKESKHE